MQNSYDSLEGGGVDILKGCGLGPNIQRLLQSFWGDQTVVPKARRYFGWPLRTERGVTQGDPF